MLIVLLAECRLQNILKSKLYLKFINPTRQEEVNDIKTKFQSNYKHYSTHMEWLNYLIRYC